MRVLTLIDSLIAAGAERMAVNIANGLSRRGVQSFLCATRKGGPLEVFVDEEVKLLLLNKRHALDVRAFWRLRCFVSREQIGVVHAHSSSLFWAVLLKLSCPRLKLVWHDHFGYSEQLHRRPRGLLRVLVKFCSYVFVVNDKLLKYAVEKLALPAKKVAFLPNFADLEEVAALEKPLPDDGQGPRLVCLANLRRQKDHDNLLDAFVRIRRRYPAASLLLVGGHFSDDYFRHLSQRLLKEAQLGGRVHILGSRNDVAAILQAADLGLLSSLSEGLPVSLLEYGMAALPVVSTNVGDCALVLDQGRCGRLVPPSDPEALAAAVVDLLDSPEEARRLAEALKGRVATHFSATSALDKIEKVYAKILS